MKNRNIIPALALSAAMRTEFPEHEPRLPWLGGFLDAAALIDAATAMEMSRITRETGLEPGCGPGCGHCCAQPVPVTPCEVAALAWYAENILEPDKRLPLAGRLRKSGRNGECPFLMDGICAAYEARPMICRRFCVAGRACAPGEDPTVTRPGAVPVLDQTVLDRAASFMRPFYGSDALKKGWVEPGTRPGKAMILQLQDWGRLADRLERAAARVRKRAGAGRPRNPIAEN